MIHLIVLRYVLVGYVLTAPYILIYLQQSLFKLSFDDELGNRLILRLQLVSSIIAFAMFLSTFDGSREFFLK